MAASEIAWSFVDSLPHSPIDEPELEHTTKEYGTENEREPSR
jgi:hypothetical protein